ncbi:MAG TPA: hypothetical protein VK171_16530 [Fimbriimonas sp.]|nr:hypothetical protein [Fimbriimonas sp.]
MSKNRTVDMWWEVISTGQGNPTRTDVYSPSSLETFRAHHARLAPYVQKAKSTTKQGILLEIICSDAPLSIVSHAAYLYQGFRRGLVRLVQLVERENRMLKQQVIKPIQVTAIHVDILVAIAHMQTDKSHRQLMKFAGANYHEDIRASAATAMAYEGEIMDSKFALEVLKDPSLPSTMRRGALHCVTYNDHKYSRTTLNKIIWPLLEHEDEGFAMDAVRYVGQTMAGVAHIRGFLKANQDFLATRHSLKSLIIRVVDETE